MGSAPFTARQLLLVGAKSQVRRMFEITGTGSILESENIAVLSS